MALSVTGAGGVCLLVGLMLLGRAAGSYDVDVVLAARTAIQNDAAYLPALILILIGAFTKSAQFPFHFWLPHAMAAPTPVSAYLHRSAARRVGKECVSTCRFRGWPYPKKKKQKTTNQKT